VLLLAPVLIGTLVQPIHRLKLLVVALVKILVLITVGTTAIFGKLLQTLNLSDLIFGVLVEQVLLLAVVLGVILQHLVHGLTKFSVVESMGI
jgi:hypothetical protein